MTKISAGVAAANAAEAVRIDGPLILSIARVLDEHAAFAGVEAGMTRGASGEDAIHHVNAERNVIRDLLGATDAHEITRAVTRQQLRYFAGHYDGDFVRLADSETPDSIAGKIEIEKLPRAFAAQVGESSALHDAELQLRQIAVPASLFKKISAGAAGPLRGGTENSYRDVARPGGRDAAFYAHRKDQPRGPPEPPRHE